MKPKLVCIDDTFLNGVSGHHLPLFERYFDVSDYDSTLIYDRDTTFLYRHDRARQKVKQYEGSCRFIADGIWETNFFCDDNFDQDTMGLICSGHESNDRVLAVPKWFWFEEHYSQQDKKALIKDMPFTHRKSNSFLMQIGDRKYPRVRLYDVLKKNNLLKDSLHSFLAYGIGLEGNFPESEYDVCNPPFSQREYRPEWYNKTHFTLVPEFSNILEADTTFPVNDSVFITEKSMKPIMYGHPFIILGDTGTYDTLESWGFHTFPELFDQKFDKESDIDTKIDMVVEQVSKYQNKDVQDKVIHNFNHFWNTDFVERLIIEEMIMPILEFVNGKNEI